MQPTTTSTAPRLVAVARVERLRASGRFEDAKLLDALLAELERQDEMIFWTNCYLGAATKELDKHKENVNQ